MMKNEKGITLIALIITIIVMLILLSATAYFSVDTYKESVYTAFVMQMQIIQKKVDTLVSDNDTEIGIIITESSKKTEIEETIKKAKNGDEITNWDITLQNIRYFSKEDVKNILALDNIDYNIIVNFDTREVVSLEGIEYEGITYYTQYKLLQGQKVSQYDYEGIKENRERSTNFGEINITRQTVEAENVTIDNADGLNCTVVISDIGITNGTLKYKLKDEIWQTITNYTKAGKNYAVQISKSGTYVFKLIDNTTSSEYENSKYIEVVNKPQKDMNLSIEKLPDEYDYSDLTNSNNWAYYYQAGFPTYVWIPRLAYKTVYYTDSTYTQTQEQESRYERLEIKFTKGMSNVATDDTYLDKTWNISDIFIDESGNKLTGKWVQVNSTLGNNLLELIQQNENI
ncbi:MAG: hypothetical protein E7310_02385 [Clostridiales bacterium]|nr:hypothetical protein [Clostridiales bacterium]